MVQDASKSDLFSESAQVYVRYAEAEVEKHINFIRKFDKDDLAYYRKFTPILKKGFGRPDPFSFCITGGQQGILSSENTQLMSNDLAMWLVFTNIATKLKRYRITAQYDTKNFSK